MVKVNGLGRTIQKPVAIDVTTMRVNIKMIKSMELVILSGRVAIHMLEITNKMNVVDMEL